MKDTICTQCFKDFTFICEVVPKVYCIFHENEYKVLWEPCHKDCILWSYKTKPIAEDPDWEMEKFDKWLEDSKPPTSFCMEVAWNLVDTFIKGGYRIHEDGLVTTWCYEQIAKCMT